MVLDPTNPNAPDTRVGRKVRLEGAGALPPAQPELPEDRPLRIGPFRILEVLGEGGMGVVYLAEQQEHVTRKVALKIIRSPLKGPESDYRFSAERQALARLSHPCVARLYEAGTTTDGHPYFAMEYVEGQSLTAFCDGERMGLRDRLNVFRAVCEGVEHAHQKGVLHRDLKPSNILAAREGERVVPKIIDFGIATALDDPQPGLIAGTPAYMSPEGFEEGRDLDTRADVYSLGVVLHELLAGIRPLDDEGSFTQVHRSAGPQRRGLQRASEKWTTLDPQTQQEVARSRGLGPNTLRRLLKGDLDWILAKALAPNRDHRYGSPAELSADLGRYLAREPVLARPASPLYRVTCHVRRNRGLVAAGLLLMLALVGGIGARTLEARRATREARRAEEQAALARNQAGRADEESRRAEAEAVRAGHQAEEARSQAARAEAQTRLAETARAQAQLEAKTAQEVSDFLQGLFKVSTPSEALGNSITAREVLDKGAARIEKDLSGQPKVQARLMQSMGGAYVQLGLYKQAEPLLEKALQILKTHRDAELLGSVLNDLGALAYYRTELPKSEDYYRKALAVKRAHPPLDPKEEARSLASLANPLLRQAKYAEAEAVLLEARALLAKVKADPKTESSVISSLGGVYFYQKKNAAALAAFQEALRLRKRVVGERHPELIPFLVNLDHMARAAGEWEKAEAYRREALSLCQAFLGEKHPSTALAYYELAQLADRKKDWPSVAELCRKSYEARKEALGPRHADTIRSGQGCAHALIKLGRNQEADPLLKEALEIHRQEKREATQGYRIALLNYGRVRQALKDPAGSKAAFTELLPLVREQEKTEVGYYLDCLRGLFQLCTEQKDFQGAESHIREMVVVMARQGIPDDPALALARGRHGETLMSLGRHAEAEAPLLAGTTMLAKVKGDADSSTQQLLKSLVRLYETLGRMDAAAPLRGRIQPH